MPFFPAGSDEFTQLASRLIRSNASNLDAFGTPIEGENLLIDLILKVVREESNNAKLIWEAQGSNLPDFHGVEIQVAESETGPWFAMVNPAEDGVFKNTVEHSYFVVTTTLVSGSLVHADLPDDITIYYRLRAFNFSGSKGKYSNIASVILIEGELAEITPGDLVNPDPTAPELYAKTANGNNILTWTRQGDLLDYSHSEIQVADSNLGPWFKPDIIGGDTTYRGTTPYTSDLVTVWETASDFNFIHPSVPSTLLYYRVRVVNIKNERSGWSNIVGISAAVPLEAPVLVAIGSLDDIILKWEKQDLLLFEKGIRVQVAEALGGPWYAPDDDIIDDAFRGIIVGEYLLVIGNEWVHRNIPLVGDINNNPSLRTLYYRIRRVDFSDNISDWSNVASASAGRITLASLPGLVDVGKLDPSMFDVLGAFSDHALGHWPLDDTVTGISPDALGELVDLTINNNPLKVTSSTVGEDVGVLSKSLTFSGSAGSIAQTDTGIGSLGDTWEQFSFSFWIRMPSTQVNVNQRPISYFVGNTVVIYFHVIPATGLHELRIRVGTTVYSIAMGQARNINDDQWHHVFLSYNGSSKVGKIFVDAIEFANGILQNSPDSLDQGGNLSIGAARVNSVNTNHMAGRIDEVRIFNFEPELQHVRYLYFIPQGPLAPIVDASRIPPLVIDVSKIAPLAVTVGKIAPLAVTVDKIAPNAVTETKIDGDSISTPKLKANAVEADKIAANAVVADKIAANAVVADKIAANAVEADKIDANAITADKIAANAVVADKIAANAVEADKIDANAITADKIAANAIVADKIAANAIVADKIAANAVVANNIGANQIISSHIIASAILTAHLDASVVTAEKIEARAVTAEKIAVDALVVGTNGNVVIDDEGIIAQMIAAGAITADKLAVGALFVGDMGNVVINNEGITANMLAANSVNLGSANVFGTLTADHIESDVVNIRSIWTGSKNRGSGGSGGFSPVTLTGNTTIFNNLDISQFPYIMILARIGNFNFTHTIARTTSQRVLYNLDTTRAFEVWYDVGDDSLVIDRSIEHEELGAGDIGNLTIYAVFGVTYPNATYVSPPDNSAVPSVPNNLGSTETPGTNTWNVLARWDASTNTSGYIIQYQSRVSGAAWPTTTSTTNSTGTSVTLYGSLTQDMEYRFRVQAFNDNNTSTYSGWHEDDVGNIVAAITPSGLDIIFTLSPNQDNDATIWNLSYNWNSIPNITLYTIQIGQDFGNGVWTTRVEETSSISSLIRGSVRSGRRIRFRVRTTSPTESDYANWHIEDAPDQIIATPDIPSSISFSSTTSTISGTISASSGATYYEWRRGTSGAWTTISGGGRSFTDTGLSSSRVYTYQARAGNSSGTSGARQASTSTQVLITVPSTPSTISLSSTTSSISGTISSSSGATYYQWKRSTSGTWITISGGGRSFTDTSLSAGTSYSYNARAGNTAGTSGTRTRTISTQSLAVTPSFTASRSGTTFTVRVNNRPSGTSWDADYAFGNPSSWNQIVRGRTSTTATFTSSNPSPSIYIRVRYDNGTWRQILFNLPLPTPSFTASRSGTTYTVQVNNRPSGTPWDADYAFGNPNSYNQIVRGRTSTTATFTSSTNSTALYVRVRFGGFPASWRQIRFTLTPVPAFSVSKSGNTFTVRVTNRPSGASWDADYAFSSTNNWNSIVRGRTSTTVTFNSSNNASTLYVRVRYTNTNGTGRWRERQFTV